MSTIPEPPVKIRPFPVTHRSVLAIAVPMTLAYVTTPLLGIVDTAVVGQFADASLLGGLAAGAVIFSLVFATFNFLRSGSTGLVAQAIGRDDSREEKLVALRFIILGVAAGMVLLVFSPAIVTLSILFMDPEPAVADAMTRYLNIRLLSAPLALANYAILGYVLGRGEGKLGLLLQFLLNGTNIVLSIFLGLRLGWGIAGVAWGTFGGELAGFLAGLAILSRRISVSQMPQWSELLDLTEVKRMTAINGHIMIRSFCLLTAFVLFTKRGVYLGTDILAANAVLMNLFLFAGYFLDGFATSAEQLAGKAAGARYRPAFDRTVWLTVLWGFAIATLLSAIFLGFATQIIETMTASDETRSLARDYYSWAALTAVSGVLAFQMDGVFIGATWSRDMRNMMIVSLAIFFIALYFLVEKFGNHGLWAALHIFLIVRGLLLLALVPRRKTLQFQD